MTCNQDKRFLRISVHGCSTFQEKKKASSDSYVDAVVPAENVVRYTTGCWKRRPDRQRNPTKVVSVVEWLKHRTDDQHGLGSKPTAPYCCVLGKDTLRHFLLLGGPDKQF